MIDEAYIHKLITDRINKFHDSLVERGQISAITPQKITDENAFNRCRASHVTQLGQTRCSAATDR
ncbi:MAG: hypothetical protein IH859_04365 [Chloroflexi bacterium]|nr:hypothetical protein [Chloroflexota bacterium]